MTGLKTLTGSKGWVMGQVLKSSLSRTVLETKNRVFKLQLNSKEVNVRTVGRLVGERRRCVDGKQYLGSFHLPHAIWNSNGQQWGCRLAWIVDAKFDGDKLMGLVHRNQSPYGRAVVQEIGCN